MEQQRADGMGLVALNFGMARTLTPSGFESGVSPADYYLVLTFTSQGGGASSVDVTIDIGDTPPSTVELVPGTWDLTVYGYADEADADNTANALVYFAQDDIEVEADAEPTPVEISLTPTGNSFTQSTGGTGTLSYNITLPAAATDGSLKLFAEDEPETEIAEYTKTLIAGESNIDSIEEITSGNYYIVVFANIGSNIAVWRELAQIYDDMVTVAIAEETDFSTGTGAAAITAFSLGGEEAVIDQTNKTITIDEPLLPADLNSAPVIAWTGTLIMPPADAVFNKANPIYTVYGADGTTVTYTVDFTAALSEIDIGDEDLYPDAAAIAEAILEYPELPVVGTRSIGTETLTINLPATQTVNWTASLSGTANPVINLTGEGTLRISGGTVSSASGTINSRTITNSTTGTIEVSGGTVSATTGRAVINYGNGTITISGTNTLVTSANTQNNSGTIRLDNEDGILNVNGGTVENTSTNTNARAISGILGITVNINGGTVTSSGSAAISGNANVQIAPGATVTPPYVP